MNAQTKNMMAGIAIAKVSLGLLIVDICSSLSQNVTTK